MHIVELDHVNIRTRRVDLIVAFYKRALGLERVALPDETSATRCLGRDGRVFLHIVPSKQAALVDHPQLEHFAFRAEGLEDAEARLTAMNVAFRKIVRGETTALDFRDPDGNRLHLDFPTSGGGA